MEKQLDYINLSQLLLDYVCDVKGILETISFLLEYGYTQRDLVEMGFGVDDIIIVLHN